jgi:hypothetical protein
MALIQNKPVIALSDHPKQDSVVRNFVLENAMISRVLQASLEASRWSLVRADSSMREYKSGISTVFPFNASKPQLKP